MNFKCSHVEHEWYGDETDSSGHEMPEQGGHADLEVAQQLPQLQDGSQTDRSYSEESNPFDAEGCTE